LIPETPGNNAAMPPNAPNGGAANDREAATARLRASRVLPPNFKAKPEAGYHESGWPLVIVNERDGATMGLVPGGTFTMGSDHGDPWNGPAHSVRLSSYYIDQHEVTNRQFRTFLEETKYHGRPPGKWLTDEKLKSMPDNAPVVSVSYSDAEEYCIWAHKRLPTEAQWEMAARSTDGRRYPWGDQPIRWSRPRAFHQIDPVTSFPEDVSPFGVFDMAGNAVEWVRDWYDPRYFDKSRDKTTEDPAGPPDKRRGIQRVVKGCSKDWLVFGRQGMDLDRRLPYLGFRCSLAVEGGEASAIVAPRPAKPETPKPGATPVGGQVPGGNVPF
jgi:formylglycine-generating enzyme required for sulfatase activity